MHDYPPPAKSHCFFIDAKLLHGSYIGSIVKIPPAPQENKSYKELEFTEEDRANIYELITTMSQSNEFQLIFKQSHLKVIGAQINHVHPLKFLSSIFSNQEIKSLMHNIRDNSFKWNKLIDGLGAGLTRESIKGKLDLYLNDFASEIGLSSEEIRPYFQSRDWDSFVRFLIQS